MLIFIIFYSAELVFEIYMTVPVSLCAGRGVWFCNTCIFKGWMCLSMVEIAGSESFLCPHT